MVTWAKSAAIAELETIIEEISDLYKQQRLSADHVCRHIRTLAFLEDVFGRDSRHYATFASLPRRRTGSFLVGGVGEREGSLNPQGAIERKHQTAYIQQLEIASGLLQAAISRSSSPR